MNVAAWRALSPPFNNIVKFLLQKILKHIIFGKLHFFIICLSGNYILKIIISRYGSLDNELWDSKMAFLLQSDVANSSDVCVSHL